MMVDGSTVMWGSLLGSVTAFVGYQAGALKTAITAERNYRDPETGLITRKGFEHRALQMISKRVGPMVVMVDLNDLKQVNDSFGHEAGDAFIREQADRIRNWATERRGIAARFGGDEFVAVVRDEVSVVGLKEELSRPIEWGGHTRYWTASVGSSVVPVQVLRKDQRMALSLALSKADRAMYKDKGGEKRGRR